MKQIVSLENLPQVSLKDAPLILGFLLGIINMYADQMFGIPLAELTVGVFICYTCLKTDNFLRPETNNIAAIGWSILFLIWVAVATLAQGQQFTYLMVEELKYVVLLLPALFICLMPDHDRHTLFKLTLGIFCGFIAYFAYLCISAYMSGYISFILKNLQPTPLLLVATLFIFKDRLSPGLKIYLLSALGFTILMGIVLGSRGALLSIGIGLFFYTLVRYVRFNRTMIAFTFITALTLHIGLGLIEQSVLDKVLQEDVATVSNMERAYLIDFSLNEIKHSPWVGIGRPTFANTFAYEFQEILKDPNRLGLGVQSPHNTFLEIAVYFGIPALLFFALAVFTITRFALRISALNMAWAAFVLSLLVRHGALYGFSSHYRLELLFMWALVFVMLNVTNSEPAKTNVKAK